MKQIRDKFSLYYVILIVLSVMLFEFLIIGFSSRFFYHQVEVQLEGQSGTTLENLYRAYDQGSLEKVFAQNRDLISKSTNYEVQVYNKAGVLILCSSGEWQQENRVMPDIEKALGGQGGKWTGRFLNDRKVMALSEPIIKEGSVVGVLRLVAPLGGVDLQIKKMAVYFIAMGLFVIGVTSMGAYILADTVTTPIQNLIKVTRRMGKGDFSVKAKREYDDEIGELSDTINHLSEEILKREDQKNSMFSSVSHELRTPLTAIRGWAETLNDPMYTKGSEDLEEGLSVIVDESTRLQWMVEELLDFSRMMAIEMSFEPREVLIKPLIQGTLQTLRQKGAKKEIQLLDIVEAELTWGLDPGRIKQLLINLVDNAIKFTPEKGLIEVLAYELEGVLHLEVKDSGIGISEEELPLVKERFYKGKHSGAHLGLGLAICDEIVKAHCGHLDIKSTLGEGTSIEVTLPRVHVFINGEF